MLEGSSLSLWNSCVLSVPLSYMGHGPLSTLLTGSALEAKAWVGMISAPP